MSSLPLTVANPYGWLRSPPFDLTLIVGVAVLALASGAVVVAKPSLFPLILFLDLWFLGYQHVIATFTRLTFDTDSFRQNKFLVIGLPWIVLAATIAIGYSLGFWAIATTYLYWQWFHYTRQSYGIMRYYARKAGETAVPDARMTSWALYLIPLFGILYRSYQHQEKFLGMEMKYLPVNEYVLYVVGAAALASLAYWLARQVTAWREGRMPVALTLYMLSHFVIFIVGYVLIEDITFGWLVLNVWHNAQYILVVWMYNTSRFKNGIDARHRFLSTLSQTRILNTVGYFLVCMLITSVVYGGILAVVQIDRIAAIPLAAVIVYQTINFHHYIVDALIWKGRKRKPPGAVQPA